jgi:hypothetical protein
MRATLPPGPGDVSLRPLLDTLADALKPQRPRRFGCAHRVRSAQRAPLALLEVAGGSGTMEQP